MTATPRRQRTNHLLAAWRVAGFFIYTFWRGVLHHTSIAGRGQEHRYRMSLRHGGAWSRGVLRLLGVKVTTTGPFPPAPALLAPNHMGYLDIWVVYGHAETLLLAKKEVGEWPVMGRLLRASCHPVVSRTRNRAVAETSQGIDARFDHGMRVCAFLEGTSTGHDRVLPFGPSFVQPAVAKGIPVVPVGIRWRAAEPGVDLAEDVSFWKDHMIWPHFWRLCGIRGLEVEVAFGEPIPTEGGDRKAIAARARMECARLAGLPCIDERGWLAPEEEAG